MQLTSVSNRQLTLLRKLNQKKYREKEQLFLIEGVRSVRQIMENGQPEIKGLFFDASRSLWEDDDWQDWGGRPEAAVVEESHFMEVSDTDHPQGVIAVCKMPDEVGREALAASSTLLLATDGIQDPGNLGTLIRTASWFGVGGLLSGKGTVDLFHPKVVRSTAGATGSIPYSRVSLDRDLTLFEDEGWEVLLLDGSAGSADLRSFSPPEKAVLVVGNEAHGIDRNLFADNRIRLRIPASGGEEGVESLNAAIAAGIALYSLSG